MRASVPFRERPILRRSVGATSALPAEAKLSLVRFAGSSGGPTMFMTSCEPYLRRTTATRVDRAAPGAGLARGRRGVGSALR
jgi:hypothetical protein